MYSPDEERWVGRDDGEYPASWLEVRCPPSLLAVRGPCIPQSRNWVSIVGPTNPSIRARHSAYEFARSAAAANVHLAVASRCRIGQYAMWGAWEERSETVVLFDSELPRRRRQIPSAIWLSPFGPSEIDAYTRQVSCASLLGTLGSATIVIEEADGVMSRAAVEAALDEGREVLVHTTASLGSGRRLECSTLLGAETVTGWDDVALLLGWQSAIVL